MVMGKVFLKVFAFKDSYRKNVICLILQIHVRFMLVVNAILERIKKFDQNKLTRCFLNVTTCLTLYVSWNGNLQAENL